MQLWVFGVLATLKVSGNETGGAFALHEDLIPPGSKGPYPHYHSREDEFWYVTEGELTWIVEGEELSAPKGSFFHLKRGVLHGFENRSVKYARMLAMYTPAKFQEWFIKVGKPIEGKASLESFPGPTPVKEDYRMAFNWMEEYGLGFPCPPEDAIDEDHVEHEEL